MLAESAFQRMLERTLGMDMEEIKKIPRSDGGISYGAALERVNRLMGERKAAGKYPMDAPLNRSMAVELVASAPVGWQRKNPLSLLCAGK